MLGFSVSIYELTNEKKALVWYEGSFNCLAWIDQLVEKGHAELVAVNGGYPVIYQIKASVIKYLVTHFSEEELTKSANIFKRTSLSYPSLKIFYDNVAVCPTNSQLIIEAWDQS